MRSIWRTPERDLVRDIALVCLADALVGASFGAISVGLGLPLWLPVLLSVVVFAGAAQFIFVGIIGAGGSPVAAVAAGLLVNARHVPFGFAVGDVLGTGWLRRLAGTHLMVDETVAFTLAQDGPRRRGLAYWTCGAGLFASWNAGVVAGAFGGRAVGDTDAFGLDAAFPAVLLALVLPSLALGGAAARAAAVTGALIALGVTPFVPAGVPVLMALAAVAIGVRGKRAAEAEPGQRPAPTTDETAAAGDRAADARDGGAGR
jgi:predicted branched-subunit amino acid permease